MIWITLLLFLIVDAYVEHLREFKATVKNELGVNHWASMTFRVLYWTDLMWRFNLHDPWQILCFAVGGFFSFWLLFNLVLNWMNGDKWNALGTTAWLDNFENAYQVPVLFVKALLGSGGIIFFYYHPW